MDGNIFLLLNDWWSVNILTLADQYKSFLNKFWADIMANI